MLELSRNAFTRHMFFRPHIRSMTSSMATLKGASPLMMAIGHEEVEVVMQRMWSLHVSALRALPARLVCGSDPHLARFVISEKYI